MNSMLQGLSNVSALREFFVSGAFESDLNPSNPLGAEGRLAQAFASLLRLMWGNGASVVSPRNFKHVLGQFAPQFAGYGQQDSQEFCNYVLDKLHEDVNRILKKPYVENFEPKGHETDRYIFGEVRRRHRLRNDSRLAELFEGYFKSTVVCPACDRVSVTFDPFMSLAVPLSVSDARRLAATLVRRDGTLHQLRLSVPIHGTVRHLLQAAAEHVAATDPRGTARRGAPRVHRGVQRQGAGDLHAVEQGESSKAATHLPRRDGRAPRAAGGEAEETASAPAPAATSSSLSSVSRRR